MQQDNDPKQVYNSVDEKETVQWSKVQNLDLDLTSLIPLGWLHQGNSHFQQHGCMDNG